MGHAPGGFLIMTAKSYLDDLKSLERPGASDPPRPGSRHPTEAPPTTDATADEGWTDSAGKPPLAAAPSATVTSDSKAPKPMPSEAQVELDAMVAKRHLLAHPPADWCTICHKDPGHGDACEVCGQPRVVWTEPVIVTVVGACVAGVMIYFFAGLTVALITPWPFILTLIAIRVFLRSRRSRVYAAKLQKSDLAYAQHEQRLRLRVAQEKAVVKKRRERLEATHRCAFCFTHVQVQEFLVRANGTPGPDTHIQQHLGLAMPPMALPLDTAFPTWMEWGRWWEKTDRQRSPPRDAVCPHCHLHAPTNPLNQAVRRVVVSVVGGRSAGKSVYLAVLLRELQDRLCQALDFSCISASTYAIDGASLERLTSEQLAHRRFSAIYKTSGANVLAQTRTARIDAQVRLPFIFNLIPHGNGRGLTHTVEVVLYDVAGEDLQSESAATAGARSIFHSDLIILVADPFEQEALHGCLTIDERTQFPRVEVRASSVLADLVTLIYKQRHLAPSERIPAHLAVTMSKFDRVRTLVEERRCPYLDRDSLLLQPKDSVDGYRDDHGGAVDSEARAFWARIADARMASLLPRFEASRCFVSSALACTDPGAVQVQPERVEDPLLWFLAHKGLIPTRSA
jgi:hypothetical protein